ncbi:morphogenic membrane protein MmpB [Kitasatospora phosalacinea]|uniref:Morphogenic membrane protein MmpB n=1 Tax=Kitasatospora phosalacinea TaxID=2065 RepID=A0ABW6GV37_9ACTN
MLWSDPRDEPSQEAREVLRRLRRTALVLALLALAGAVLVLV